MSRTYSINTVDTETTPAWMSIAAKVTPGAQDSGRCRYTAEVEDGRAQTLEAALNADEAVLEYSVMAAHQVNIYRNAGEWCYALYVDGQYDTSDTIGVSDDATESEAREEISRLFPGARIERVSDTAVA